MVDMRLFAIALLAVLLVAPCAFADIGSPESMRVFCMNLLNTIPRT